VKDSHLNIDPMRFLRTFMVLWVLESYVLLSSKIWFKTQKS